MSPKIVFAALLFCSILLGLGNARIVPRPTPSASYNHRINHNYYISHPSDSYHSNYYNSYTSNSYDCNDYISYPSNDYYVDDCDCH